MRSKNTVRKCAGVLRMLVGRSLSGSALVHGMSDQLDRNIWEVVGVPCSVIASPTHVANFLIPEKGQDLSKEKFPSSSQASGAHKDSQENKDACIGAFNGSDEVYNVFIENGSNAHKSEHDELSHAVGKEHVRTHVDIMNPTKDNCCNGVMPESQSSTQLNIPMMSPEDIGSRENGLGEQETKKVTEALGSGAASVRGQSSSQDRSLFDLIRDSFTLPRKDDRQTSSDANDSTVTSMREEVVMCSSDGLSYSEVTPSANICFSQEQGAAVNEITMVPKDALNRLVQCHRQFPFTERLKRLSLESQQKGYRIGKPITTNLRGNSVGVMSPSHLRNNAHIEDNALHRINGVPSPDFTDGPAASPVNAVGIPTPVLTSQSPAVSVLGRNGHSADVTVPQRQQSEISVITHCGRSNGFDTCPIKTSISCNTPVKTVLPRINIPPAVESRVPFSLTPSASPGLQQFSAEPRFCVTPVRINRTPFDLSCRESIVPSPELRERNVSPVLSSSRLSSSATQCVALISSQQAPATNRGSVQGELEMTCSSQEEHLSAGACALRESAHRPDVELRCDSPAPTEVSCSENSSSLQNCVVKNYSLLASEDDMAEDKSACESNFSEISVETADASQYSSSSRESELSSKKNAKSGTTAMVRRLEPKLPSPSRELSEGDLYRDPSQLTREERALQRAMMRFSEMEMKEKGLALDGVVKRRRRRKLRNHLKNKLQVGGARKESGASTWLKTFKRKRLWISQKTPGQDVSTRHRLTNGVRRNMFSSSAKSVPRNKEEPKKHRRIPEDDSKDGGRTKLLHRKRKVRAPVKEEDAPPTELVTKRRRLSHDAGMSAVKAAKRTRSDSAPGSTCEQGTNEKIRSSEAKADRSRRVKTYLLVASYQGFKDFKPVVLESRTRKKSKTTDNCKEYEQAPMVKPPPEPQFPLLVVESVKSKPVKEMVIAENEQMQQMVENCLKARGKWHNLEPTEEQMEDLQDLESMKEAKKLTVNRTTGETILHKAARLGYHDTVHSYITQGADPGAKDNAGWSPLHEACSRGKLGVAKVLTRFGADANACSNDGIRPVHDAAEGGHVDVLRVLLSYGADPMLATYSGNTSLNCAKNLRTRNFLTGYLEDADLVNSLHSNTLDENPWEFSGSCSAMDDQLNPDHVTGILDTVPESASVCDGEFELSDQPHLPSYNLPVASDDVIVSRRNYVLLQDVLDRLNVSRAALARKMKKLDMRQMPWSEFLGEVCSSQMNVRPKFVPTDGSTGEATAELLPITYNLRRVLGIRVESVAIR